MNSTRNCFEIVHLAFRPNVSFQQQTDAMQTLGNWVGSQPGFVTRHSYHDPRQDRWTDVVEWTSLEEATAAMSRSQREPALAGVMALIDPATVHAGHFERQI